MNIRLLPGCKLDRLLVNKKYLNIITFYLIKTFVSFMLIRIFLQPYIFFAPVIKLIYSTEVFYWISEVSHTNVKFCFHFWVFHFRKTLRYTHSHIKCTHTYWCYTCRSAALTPWIIALIDKRVAKHFSAALLPILAKSGGKGSGSFPLWSVTARAR